MDGNPKETEAKTITLSTCQMNRNLFPPTAMCGMQSRVQWFAHTWSRNGYKPRHVLVHLPLCLQHKRQHRPLRNIPRNARREVRETKPIRNSFLYRYRASKHFQLVFCRPATCVVCISTAPILASSCRTFISMIPFVI